jgi:hypothetical protein
VIVPIVLDCPLDVDGLPPCGCMYAASLIVASSPRIASFSYSLDDSLVCMYVHAPVRPWPVPLCVSVFKDSH